MRSQSSDRFDGDIGGDRDALIAAVNSLDGDRDRYFEP